VRVRYYNLVQVAPEYSTEWGGLLASSVELEAADHIDRALTYGTRVENVVVSGICRGGPLPDYPFVIPQVSVASPRMRHLFEAISSETIQILELNLRNQITGEDIPGYVVANLVEHVECVDRQASVAAIFTKESLPNWEKHPHMLGQYRTFHNLVLSRAAIAGRSVFRVAGWPMSTIVTESFVEAVSQADLTGCRFEEVHTSE